jgi:hypothetical protein
MLRRSIGIPRRGSRPNDPAVVAALELVGLELAALIRIFAAKGQGRRYATEPL